MANFVCRSKDVRLQPSRMLDWLKIRTVLSCNIGLAQGYK